MTGTSALFSTYSPRKKSPTGRPCTPQCTAPAAGVPVGPESPLMVVVGTTVSVTLLVVVGAGPVVIGAREVSIVTAVVCADGEDAPVVDRVRKGVTTSEDVLSVLWPGVTVMVISVVVVRVTTLSAQPDLVVDVIVMTDSVAIVEWLACGALPLWWWFPCALRTTRFRFWQTLLVSLRDTSRTIAEVNLTIPAAVAPGTIPATAQSTPTAVFKVEGFMFTGLGINKGIFT